MLTLPDADELILLNPIKKNYMQSLQDKINLWLNNEAMQGRRSPEENLTETEASILVQRFATDVERFQGDENEIENITFQKLETSEGYKMIVETPAGIGISFRK